MSELQPYQQRVVDERAELAQKLAQKLGALDGFIERAPYFNELPAAERERMRLQRAAMLLYASILTQRIAAF